MGLSSSGQTLGDEYDRRCVPGGRSSQESNRLSHGDSMQTLELFAGCGGLAKGLELAGFAHAGFIEFNHQACESLRANFDSALVHEVDVRKFDFRRYSSVEIVSGGPPCQPFSLGGLAKAHDDVRDMFPQAARAIAEIKPKAFLFENVKGLLRPRFSSYFEYILQRLANPECAQLPGESWQEHSERLRKSSSRKKKSRYRVSYKLLNAADYGVPQVRERVFIVGIREDLNVTWEWPQPSETKETYVTIEDALKGVPDPRSPQNNISDHAFVGGARVYPGHTGADVSKPSKTIKAGAHGVPGGENMLRLNDGSVRYMTIHEAKLIQTFPADFVITGGWSEAMRQIGNAVPVRLAEIVGRKLRELLENT